MALLAAVLVVLGAMDGFFRPAGDLYAPLLATMAAAVIVGIAAFRARCWISLLPPGVMLIVAVGLEFKDRWGWLLVLLSFVLLLIGGAISVLKGSMRDARDMPALEQDPPPTDHPI
jgi:hypothetical protein